MSNLISGKGTVPLQLAVTAETGFCQVGGQSFLVTVGHLTLLLRFKSPAGLCPTHTPNGCVCVCVCENFWESLFFLSCLDHQRWRVSSYCWGKLPKEDTTQTETKPPGERCLKHHRRFLRRDTRSETQSLHWNEIEKECWGAKMVARRLLSLSLLWMLIMQRVLCTL